MMLFYLPLINFNKQNPMWWLGNGAGMSVVGDRLYMHYLAFFQ
jgi:hypothetical protein